MTSNTGDLRIREIRPLISPEDVMREFKRNNRATDTVIASRKAVHDILGRTDDRLVAIVGPCSIHDPKAALDYARRLAGLRRDLADDLEVVMRVYFEKPRTTIGWKGLINDPYLDGSFDINNGLRIARGLLVDINALGVPAAVEFLDMTTPQYLADLVSWGAIGARTTESQVHRELASGLSCPVGFKNGTDGNIKIAVDAVRSAAQPHHFLAVTRDGHCAIAATTGNSDCHVILRGGKKPNYDAASLEAACNLVEASGLAPRVMVDASHANSSKKAENQPRVLADIADRIRAGETRIFGIMAESNLVAGRQDLVPGEPLVYGQSITDACVDWNTTVDMLRDLADAVKARRKTATTSDQPVEEAALAR